MIASFSTHSVDEQSHCVNELFQAMLPQIRRQASIQLRHLRTEARDEALAEVVARAFCARRRLVEQGRAEIARPTPLVKYAVRQVRAGRRIGGRQNSQDIMSPQAGRIHGFALERLDRREVPDWSLEGIVGGRSQSGPR